MRIVKRNNDRRKEICEVYSKIFEGFNADPDTVICDGCSCEKENPVLLDPTFKVRKCVINKKYLHCGYCDQYPCDIFPSEPTQEELVQKIEVEKRWTWEDEKLMENFLVSKNCACSGLMEIGPSHAFFISKSFIDNFLRNFI